MTENISNQEQQCFCFKTYIIVNSREKLKAATLRPDFSGLRRGPIILADLGKILVGHGPSLSLEKKENKEFFLAVVEVNLRQH